MSNTGGDETNAGSAEGSSAAPLPSAMPLSDEAGSSHQGDIEIGIGTPVGTEEYRRLKREARRLGQTSDAADSDQDNTERDEE